MNTLLSRARCLAVALIWAMLCVGGLTLPGCGGGGGGGGGGSSGSTTTSVPATIIGVVAVGAPLIGASLTVLDAAGVAQGSAITSLADGSYQLTLNSASPTLPLFIEATGTDMFGTPVVLHTVVQTLTSGANAKTVAHVTPLTNAVVALLLGGEPRAHFLNALSSNAVTKAAELRTWSLLGNAGALSAAATFVKTTIKANLTDAKLTDLTKVDLFKDVNFTANKTGVDGAIEGVRVQFGLDVDGNELLMLSNKLVLAGTTEVSVKLPLAQTNLSNSTPTISAAAVVSTLKATTGSSSMMPYVAGLNTLAASINLGLAQHISNLEFGALGVFYTTTNFTWYFDGFNALAMASKLAGYGSSNYQLSNWQILGCLDYPVATRGCAKVHVAALVRNASGAVVDIFDNAVTYSSSTGWTLRGNDKQTPWYTYPITWAVWDATGALDATVSPNPGLGLQVTIKALDFMLAWLSVPNGSTVTFNYCRTIPNTPMCVGATETGDLIDDEVLRASVYGWIGTSDTKPGARYQIDTATLSSGSESNSALFTADMPKTTSLSVYPLPDNLSASAPLSATNFINGLTIDWANWAAANPNMRVIEVRGVITSTATAPVTQSVTVLPLGPTRATLPVFSTVPSDAIAYNLWLIAQDDQGRRYVSKITALP